MTLETRNGAVFHAAFRALVPRGASLADPAVHPLGPFCCGSRTPARVTGERNLIDFRKICLVSMGFAPQLPL
jgi:hypothetical protein